MLLLRRRGRLDAAEQHARRALRYAEESHTSELASGGLARVELPDSEACCGSASTQYVKICFILSSNPSVPASAASVSTGRVDASARSNRRLPT